MEWITAAGVAFAATMVLAVPLRTIRYKSLVAGSALGFFLTALVALSFADLEALLQTGIAVASFFVGFVLLVLEAGIRRLERSQSRPARPPAKEAPRPERRSA